MSTFSSGQYFETFENEIVDKQNGMEGVNHLRQSCSYVLVFSRIFVNSCMMCRSGAS